MDPRGARGATATLGGGWGNAATQKHTQATPVFPSPSKTHTTPLFFTFFAFCQCASGWRRCCGRHPLALFFLFFFCFLPPFFPIFVLLRRVFPFFVHNSPPAFAHLVFGVPAPDFPPPPPLLPSVPFFLSSTTLPFFSHTPGFFRGLPHF